MELLVHWFYLKHKVVVLEPFDILLLEEGQSHHEPFSFFFSFLLYMIYRLFMIWIPTRAFV